MNRLEGKVAIITGAANGMGLAAAKLFAEEGAKVIATDISSLENIEAIGHPDITAMKLNVVSAEDWDHVVKEALSRYGKIDVLVNNAGIQLGPYGILNTKEEDWDKIMNVDVKGVWYGMRAVIPTMKEQGKGSIINTSLLAGLLGGLASGGSAAYCAAKGAVRSFTKFAANEFGKDGIRVNSVHPGTTITSGAGATEQTWDEATVAGFLKAIGDATPLKMTMAESIDMAYIYLYLASDESRFATGAEFVIDGGMTSH